MLNDFTISSVEDIDGKASKSRISKMFRKHKKYFKTN